MRWHIFFSFVSLLYVSCLGRVAQPMCIVRNIDADLSSMLAVTIWSFTAFVARFETKFEEAVISPAVGLSF